MPIASDFTSIYSKDWKINFLQCYPNGYLKYTELCNILQLTASKHSVLGGISFTDMQEFNQAWVLSRMRVEILNMPQWKDIVTVKTWIVNLENSRSVRAVEMYVNGVKMIGVETYWAVFNTDIRRPEALALPHEHFIKYPKNNPTLENTKKINISEVSKTISNRKIMLSDLDIVNHVNNVKYLEWCLDLVDAESILTGKLKSFDMNFMKELMFEDEIFIQEMNTNENSIYTISKEDKISFALQLNWK